MSSVIITASKNNGKNRISKGSNRNNMKQKRRSQSTIKANGLHTIKNKKDKCNLTDRAILSDKNILAKEFDKLSNYKDLEIEIA